MVLHNKPYMDEGHKLRAGDGPAQKYGGTTQGLKAEGLEPITLTWEHIDIWAPKPNKGCSSFCFRGSPTQESEGTVKQILNDGKWGLILGLRPANERRRYFVTTSLIGWAEA